MPYRRLPNTDQARLYALQTAVQKASEADFTEQVLTYKTLNEARRFLINFESKSSLLTGLLALNPAAIAKSLFLSTKSSIKNGISLNVSFKSSNVIAELLLVMINLPSVFLPLFTLLAFLSGYFDLFNTP